ncbi:MAG: TIM barrel protein [Bacillota bacterium]|nr:TIM barrel protein [Bacillota bacterium]
MIQLSLCLETVFPEKTFADRIRLAAEAGYKNVEFWDPSDKDLEQFAAVAAANNVRFAACTLNEPRNFQLDRSAGPVIANVRRSIDMARSIGCSTMIGLSSDISSRADTQKNILVENLKRVADLLVQADMTLVLEPLNSFVDHKGYYLDSSATAFEIAKCVNCPNIKVLYDIYHMQIMEGNIVANMTENLEWIGHVHTAGVPGRHEPIDNEVNYPYVLKKIDAQGYKGYVGLEYWPTIDHKQSITDCLTFLSV